VHLREPGAVLEKHLADVGKPLEDPLIGDEGEVIDEDHQDIGLHFDRLRARGSTIGLTRLERERGSRRGPVETTSSRWRRRHEHQQPYEEREDEDG